ncbi:MAG: bacteriohemerythrin [Turneriella sp.]
MTTNTVAEFSVSEIFDPFFLESLHKQWLDDHLTLGADLIDAQHLWLIALVLKMEWLLKVPVSAQRQAKLQSYGSELLQFLASHLELEELVMKTAEMPQVDDISREHAELLAKLHDALNKDGGAGPEKIAGFVQAVKMWINRHIKIEDPRWKIHLGKKHFIPNDYVRSLLKDIIAEEESAHALLYRQLMVQHEVIPGIRKETLDDLFLLWKRFDVNTNLPLIDMQHLWLFKMVVEVEGMLHIAFEQRRAHLERVLSELLDYVDIHFTSEEALMATLGYAEEKGHHKLHEDFKRTVAKLKLEYDGGNHHSLSSLVTLLRQWLLTHIVIEDAKFARFCESDPQKSLNASRLLIREKNIVIPRDQTLIYMYIMARLKAS